MAKLSSDLVLSLVDKVSGPARRMDGVLDGLGRRQRMLAGAASGASTALGLLGRAGAVGGAAAALAGSAAAFNQFADVERQLTRTGLKLGATRATMADIRTDMKAIAQRYAVPIEQVMESFDSLAESGFELADARSALDGMVKATQGLGGSGSDTVATFDAARKSIGLAMKDSERFFDIVAAGGSMGKFEGSDLARYLPSLLPAASRQGYEGLEGAARLVGFLEVMRDYVGSSEEAATATADIFEKISSPDVMKNFNKLGINLEKRLAKARENGEDVLVVMHDIIKEATKGDETKLSQIFGDRDSRRAAMVLLTQIERVKEAQEGLRRSSGGTITTNVKVVTEDAQANIDRLSNSWDALVTNLGRGASTVFSPALEGINSQVEEYDAYNAGLKKEEARGGSRDEALEEYNRRYKEGRPDYNWLTDSAEMRDSFLRDMADYGRGTIESPYRRVDERINRDNPGRFPGRADAQAASDAARARQVGNLDGEQVRSGGTPVPAPRDVAAAEPMTEQQQRAEYDRGRRAGEQLLRNREAQQPLWKVGDQPSQTYLDRKRRILEERAAAKAATSPAMQLIATPAAPAPAPQVQTSAPVAMGPIKPDIAGPVKAEGEAAALAAEMAGQRISNAFSITATTKVDSSPLDAVIAKAAQARAALLSLDATSRAVASRASAATSRAVPAGGDNLYSDIER